VADGNNNNENNEQKKSTITTQVKNASKTGAKKTLKHLLKFLLPVVPILLIVMLLYALISLVVDFFQGIFEDVANFFTINLENGAYEIKDDEIDKVLEQLKDEYNLSAKDLGLLGDIDYDKASEEEKKAAERKYIKLFLEAQQTTQTINTQVAGSNGSVYMMTPKISENTITKYPDYSILWDENNPVISKEDFVKAVKGYTPPLGFGESGRNNWTSYEKFFKNNAEEFYDISTEAGINPMVMVAIGTHESGYGTSNIANEKLNLWGWGAYDSSPGQSAIDFDSEDIKEGISKGIKEVATSLKEEWTTPGTWRYERISGEGRDPTTLDGIGPLYCTTAGWSDLVKKHMLNIFGDKCKLGSSLGKYTVLEHEKDLEPMEFKKIDDFKKIVEKGGEFSKLRKYYSIDENGKLLLINFNYTNGVPNLSIQTIDYKSMISQYTTSCMFFIDTAMAVQNPKFMEAFVQMVKDSKITLNVMYNSSREVTTTTTFHYETTTNEDGTTSKRLVSSTNVVTQESYTPTIMVSTAKTWIFSREAGFKQTNLGPTYSHSDTGSGENRVIIDIESSGVSYSEETPKEEYNGGEKGEEGTFVGLLDKRFKIPNSVNRRSAGPDLVSNYVAYFEFLSRSSTTQAMENIMRYVLYKYTGRDYGVTEFDVNWFASHTMNGIVAGNAFLEFLKVWEGTATDSEGNYLVADDGVGIPTVGFGIALKYNVDRFAAKGVTGVQNWQIGDNCYKDYGVSNSIIDEIMLEEIADWKESVRKDTAACVPPLNEQQIDALTIIKYQYGGIGNFVSQWNKYGNTDILKDVVYQSGEWKYYFKQNPSDGRAEANWKLFHEGIYVDKEGNEIIGGSGTEGNTQISGMNIATYTSSSGKTYIQYKQGVGPWAGQMYGNGTIAQQGCSVTAIAIALSGYGYNFTPSNFSGPLISIFGKTSQYATGSSIVFTRGSDGLAYNQVQTQHKQDIINHLRTGNAVIYHVLGARKGYSSIYTSNQHWMVLTDVNADGTQAYVSNPNSAGPNGWNNIDTILQSLCCYIKVSQ
jgi:flagellum-specific peptidoglycan hydrolase FlgJ